MFSLFPAGTAWCGEYSGSSFALSSRIYMPSLGFFRKSSGNSNGALLIATHYALRAATAASRSGHNRRAEEDSSVVVLVGEIVIIEAAPASGVSSTVCLSVCLSLERRGTLGAKGTNHLLACKKRVYVDCLGRCPSVTTAEAVGLCPWEQTRSSTLSMTTDNTPQGRRFFSIHHSPIESAASSQQSPLETARS